MEQNSRNIFITGVTEGVGSAFAKKAISLGYTVWGIGRRKDILEELASKINSPHFLWNACDVVDQAATNEVVRAMQEKKFVPDIVILNAAAYTEDILPKYDSVLIEKSFAVNLLGSMVWIEKFLPYFLERRTGQFIAISSTSTFRPDINSISYGASKSALSMVFRTLNLHYRDKGLKFKTIYFGPVASSLAPHWLSPTGSPKSFFVLSADNAAACIFRTMHNSRKESYFFPFFLTLIFRLTLFLPDRFFAATSRWLKRK